MSSVKSKASPITADALYLYPFFKPIVLLNISNSQLHDFTIFNFETFHATHGEEENPCPLVQ